MASGSRMDTLKSSAFLGGLLLSGMLISGLLVPRPVGAGRPQQRAEGRPGPLQPEHERAVKSLAKLPLAFVPNQGQYNPEVRFAVYGARNSLVLTDTETVLTLPAAGGASAHPAGAPPARLRMRLVQGSSRSHLKANAPLPGKTHFYWGSQLSQRRTNVPQYARVRRENVYPGVDAVYYGREGKLEYDFVVAPHASTRQIQVEFAGASALSTNAEGALLVQTPSGTVVQDKPVLYQEVGNRRQPVEGEYRLCGADRVGFTVGAYDPSRPLIIDPTLTYSTYLGGSGGETAFAIDVDSNGRALIGGTTSSTDFPGQGVQSGTAFVTRLSASGGAVQWTTIFGTGAAVSGLTLDTSGAPVVTGWATGGVPTTIGCFQASPAGGTDAFAIRFTVNGLVFAATYLGGMYNDTGRGIAIDGNSRLWVVGETGSPNFPTVAAYQSSIAGGTDAFATYILLDMATVRYSTFLGGTYDDVATGVAGLSNNIGAVCGYTASSDFPTVNPLQSFGGNVDAFVCKLDGIPVPAVPANTLTFSTYFGGFYWDYAWGITKRDGKLFVTGKTGSSGLATTGAYQTALAGSYDAFVVKYTSSNTIGYCTYLGGTYEDGGYAIAVDSNENCHVTGYTYSSDFPISNAVQGTIAYPPDAFVTKFNSTATGVSYSTFLGGDNTDEGRAIATQGGNAFIAGYTPSTNFPTASPYQASLSGSSDAFVAKITP